MLSPNPAPANRPAAPALRLSRRAAVLALTLFASLLSCGREITGPGGRGALAQLSIVPNYSAMIDEVDGVMHSVSDLVPFNRVRIELRRVDNTIAAQEVVNFPASETEVPLSISVRLGDAATNEGEMFTAYLRYINAAGDTVFSGGPISVMAVPGSGGSQQPVEIPVLPTVPGSIFARIDIAPDTVIANTGQTANFTAVGYDGQDNVVANAIIGFISRNPALVTVPNLGSGNVTLSGVRGSTWIIAQSLTGVKDSAFVQVLPVPTAIDKLSGDNQTALNGAQFAQPLRVRLRAADGLPVANWPVNFAVTTGLGSLSATQDTTDANGEAEVTWTAGAPLGAASVTVSTTAPILTTVFNGTQLSTLPSSLIFQSQPSNITAGGMLPAIQVAVRNGAGTVITDFTGEVTLSLIGGTGGASIIGDVAVNAVAGVATFTELSVNRGGTAYRLVAAQGALPTVESNTFNVAAAPPTTITITTGAGQSAPPSTALADSIRVRVTDAFGFPVPGQTVQFTIAQGGGSVSAVSGITNADGRTAVMWTLGAAGAQQLRVSLGLLEQFVSATVVTGGSLEMFAGVDYTDVRAGATKTIPIFLSAAHDEPVNVALTIDDTSTTKFVWQSSVATFAIGQTRIDVPIDGLTLGTGWAIMESTFGRDSVLVSVDSATLLFAQTDEYRFVEGDTIRTYIQLSDPAPAGGITVIVRSLEPSVASVAPGSGAGLPTPGCIPSSCFGGGGLMAASLEPANGSTGRLLAPPADTAAIFIPEGQLFGEVAVLLLDDLGSSAFVELTAEADGFVGSSFEFEIWQQELERSIDFSNPPENGVGIGQLVEVEMRIYQRRPRETVIHLESSDTTIVQVDSQVIVPPHRSIAPRVYARVVGADSAWIRFTTQGAEPDSMLIFGTAPQLRISALSNVAAGGVREIQVFTSSPDNLSSEFPRAEPLTVTVETGDSAVHIPLDPQVTIPAGQPYATARMSGVGLGSSFIAVSAPGHLPDTVFFGTYVPALYTGGGGTVGAGQILSKYVELDYHILQNGPRTVNVTSLNPAALQVLTPTVELGRESIGATVLFRGIAAGASTVRFTGPGIAQTDMLVAVSNLIPAMFVSPSAAPDGNQRNITSYLWDGIGQRPMADTVSLVLRSSNPAVVQVSDSVVRFTPQNNVGNGGRYRPLLPGSADLWLVRPGVDSVSRPVTVTPFRVMGSFSGSPVGRQMEQYFYLYREGPYAADAAVTITQSGPGQVSFGGAVQFDSGQTSVNVRMIGEVVGADTLTISIPGHDPFVRVINVGTTTTELDTDDLEFTAGVTYPYAQNIFRVNGSANSPAPGRDLRFRVTSLDTSRVAVEADSITWTQGYASPIVPATLRFKAPGLANIVIADLDGVIAPDTTEFYINPASIFGSTYSSDAGLVMGMDQSTEYYEVYVQRALPSTEALWVHLSSSNPSLVSVPDSVEIAALDYYQYFTVTTGDTTGSARITASAPGYNPWYLDVLVTRSALGMYVYNSVIGSPTRTQLFTMDAMTLTPRGMNSSVDLRYTTTTPDVLDVASATPFTLPAGLAYLDVEAPRGIKPGYGMLRLEDDRGPRFDYLVPGYYEATVQLAEVKSQRRRIQVTPDLISGSYEQQFIVRTGVDFPWVRLSMLGGNAELMDDSVEVDVSGTGTTGYGYYGVRGLALGRDTLLIAMDSAVTDTVVVDVEPGVLRLLSEQTQDVVVGDSMLVRLRLFDASGTQAEAATTLTFNVSFSDGSFVAVNGGAPVSIVTSATSDVTLEFWVRAESLGTTTMTLTNANFRPFTFILNSVVRP
jgi:hypothetical protein